jgi:hypothetical protein
MSPHNFEFHLPLSPEELLKSGGVNQYVVREVLPVKHLSSQLRGERLHAMMLSFLFYSPGTLHLGQGGLS